MEKLPKTLAEAVRQYEKDLALTDLMEQELFKRKVSHKGGHKNDCKRVR